MALWRVLKAWLAGLSRQFDSRGSGPVAEFDDLLSALIGGFQRAQMSTRQRAQATIEGLFAVGDSATPGAFALKLDSDPAVITAVPAAGLATLSVPDLAELCLEFACLAERVGSGTETRLGLRMVPAGTHRSMKLRIAVTGGVRVVGQVTLDGTLLRQEAADLAEGST